MKKNPSASFSCQTYNCYAIQNIGQKKITESFICKAFGKAVQKGFLQPFLVKHCNAVQNIGQKKLTECFICKALGKVMQEKFYESIFCQTYDYVVQNI